VKKLLLIAGMIGAVAVANAVPFTFSNISNNSGQAPQLAGQLSVDVTASGSRALFSFLNNGPISSSITAVYFDDANGSAATLASIYRLIDRDYPSQGGSPGVDFSSGATPPNLPGGNGLTPSFSSNLSTDSASPVQPLGVNPGEWLGVVVNLLNGHTLSQTIAALQDGSLRIGIQVQAIGTSGQSDAFVNAPPPRPTGVPDASTTAMLLGVALLGLEGLRRRMAK